MNIALFKYNGLLFILRYGHFLAGIAWIGMLWYFNFVQGSYFKEAEQSAKDDATKKLVPRALWWFRWGAMFTVITGILLILSTVYQARTARILTGTWGITVLTGGMMGIIMWANVWFIIWPAQKLAIAKAKGESVGDISGWARRAFLASRTNTLLSLPMLFFMGAARHLPVQVDQSMVTMFLLAVVCIIILVEMNALTASQGLTTSPIETARGVITSGLILTPICYFVLELVMTMGRNASAGGAMRTVLLVVVGLVVAALIAVLLFDSFKESLDRGLATILGSGAMLGFLYLSLKVLTKPGVPNATGPALGSGLIVLLAFVIGILTIMLIVEAFRNDRTQGLLTGIVPLYAAYYLFAKYQKSDRPLMLPVYLTSLVLFLVLFAVQV